MFISQNPFDLPPPPTFRSAAALVGALRAAGEPTRLRALALLSRGELAVGELAAALGQSQPRVSRHMRLLTESGLVERAPEGSWVFYRLAAAGGAERRLVDGLVAALDAGDPATARDLERLAQVHAAREQVAAAYFERNARDWGRVSALHLPDADIEAAILDAAGEGPFDTMIDIGVGAGRMLALFAPRSRRAIGIDNNREMLAVARAELDGAQAAGAELRYGDAYEPPAPPRSADLVTIHQVLHFLSDPGGAVRAAVDLLTPQGLLLIIDFAPHALEFLRDAHAHRRLGFADEEISAWCEQAGARVCSVRSLGPAGDQGETALTVKIWAIRREGALHA